MDEDCDLRKWDELLPDALGLIFKNLSLLEILTVVPCVCKSWEKAVAGPYCWQEINIEEWSDDSDAETIDRMLRLLIPRSCGSLRKLSVSGVASEETMSFIADHAQSLETLKLPRSQINDSILKKSASILSTVTSLDLSSCINIGGPALEAIGKNCKSLTSLRRVMHPFDLTERVSQDDEALAIASTMPKLEHLEISYMHVNTPSVVEIINKCKSLELLDLRGCWDVNLEENFVKGFPKLKVVGPHVEDGYYEDIVWDDHSIDGGYLGWHDTSDSGEVFDDMWGDYTGEYDDPIGDVMSEFYHYDDHIYW